MIPFKNRFHGHGSLRYVYRHGAMVRRRMISVKYSVNPRRKQPRISVVVSKKVLKSAVGRNRIRRRVYEIVRQELPRLAPGRDIVILIFSSEVRELPIDTLTKQVQNCFTEAGLYKAEAESAILND